MGVGSVVKLRERLPPEYRRRLWQRLARLTRPAWFRVLRRTTPLSDSWGFDRGTPIDRYYIEHFLERHRDDIRGRVLEIRDSSYTDRYDSGVTQRDVLDIDPANPRATVIADLSAADAVAANQFDCFVLTQTLQFIYDTRSAIEHAQRILVPAACCWPRLAERAPIDTLALELRARAGGVLCEVFDSSRSLYGGPSVLAYPPVSSSGARQSPSAGMAARQW